MSINKKNQVDYVNNIKNVIFKNKNLKHINY